MPDALDQIDLKDPALWTGPRSELDATFAALRAHRPRAFFQERRADGSAFGGYWALTKASDVRGGVAAPQGVLVCPRLQHR